MPFSGARRTLTSSLGLSPSPFASPQAALRDIERLTSQLKPPSFSRVNEGPARSRPIQICDNVQVLAGHAHATVIATATVVSIGDSTVFHNRRVGPKYAVVIGLKVTNQGAAEQQKACMSDTNEVEEGITPLSAIDGAPIAVPLASLGAVIEEPSSGSDIQSTTIPNGLRCMKLISPSLAC